MITITTYNRLYRSDFERLNKDWLIKYFSIEPIDEEVLTRPEETILKGGGQILFALSEGAVVGTVALKRMDDGTLELTKMAVDQQHQGRGIGKLLCGEAIETARSMDAGRLVLFSHRLLAAALSVYRTFGFREIPVTPGIYGRADIMMELDLRPLPQT
ncbi:Acetyltransferase (GNAT) domain-containing protein [Parapedobacter composti]|uniref:Acetyltransferase (GNAT) domain-containing protein n=1 Tax=Parapedobacter composti TaxID=623281 RepID=A0A1I1HHY9_9SPHI|nr:GNAT family N-acetyltransferase [Parapedobacter composti]SFC23182.1 Acetyltransferase (GNAT) domain-containing protein [Parapedobacter composti]